jgi:hypothetical protein
MPGDLRSEIVDHPKIEITQVEEQSGSETGQPSHNGAATMPPIDGQANHPANTGGGRERNNENVIMADLK